jgi:ABC-type microcin C transport system permease subunit YejE
MIKSNEKHVSILRKRWLKFKTLKRGYYSLVALTFLYGISFFLPLLINNRALVVHYEGEYYFPIVSGYIPGKTFGQDVARYNWEIIFPFIMNDQCPVID